MLPFVTFVTFGLDRSHFFVLLWGSGVWSTGSRFAWPAYRSLALAHKVPLKATPHARLRSQAPTTRQRATRFPVWWVSH